MINRKDYNSQITIDVENMKVTNNVILGDTSKNIILPLIITIFVELLISLIFIKKNVYDFIIIVITNAVTNSILQYIYCPIRPLISFDPFLSLGMNNIYKSQIPKILSSIFLMTSLFFSSVQSA